jgi:transposase-like protein
VEAEGAGDFVHSVGMNKTGIADGTPYRRRRRPRAAWAKEVRAFRESGLSLDEYATKRGLHVATLARWVRILRSEVEASPASETSPFVPVTVVRSQADRHGTMADSALMIEVDLPSGTRLRARVNSDADMRRLTQAIGMLDGDGRC